MIDYTIRLATIDDLKRIQELSYKLMTYEKERIPEKFLSDENWALSEAGYENYKANIEHDWIFVVCIDGKIIGYMTCWINKKKPWLKYSNMEIGNIFIEEEYRSLGIGTALVNKAKELCKENNIEYLKIDVFEHNKRAQEFYKKNGLYQYSIEQYMKI